MEEGEQKRLASREIDVLPLHTPNAALVLKCAFYYVADFFSIARLEVWRGRGRGPAGINCNCPGVKEGCGSRARGFLRTPFFHIFI